LPGCWKNQAHRADKSFDIGQSWFPQGDSIAITSVERSANRMVVKGHYNLFSHDQATLAFYITTPTNVPAPEDAAQRKEISKGQGDFELVHSHLVPGLPHVSMYADGRSFAALYFGTKAEALEESKATWISVTNRAPAATMEPTLSTSAFQIRLVAENSETNVATDLFTNMLADSHVERLRLFKKAFLDGSAIKAAGWFSGSDGKQTLELGFTETGSQQFAEFTTTNLNRRIAIIFQGRLLLAPIILSPIVSGRIGLPVDWNKEDLERTVNGLNQMKNPVIELRFGPEQESILPPLQGPEWSFLNLRANRLVTNSLTEPGTRALNDWQRDNGADLAALISDKSPHLRGYGMVITTAGTNGWATSTPADIWYNWNLMVNEPKPEVVLAEVPGKASGVYYFRTRDDCWGILQIIGFTKEPGTNFMANPSDVKIRYKLVQAANFNPVVDPTTGLPVAIGNTRIDPTTGLPIAPGNPGAIDSTTGLPAMTTNTVVLPAIQTWLALMDGGRYAESWRQASEGFRALVTQDDWVNKGESIRKPLGKLLSRKVEKAEPNGPYFVATYDSSFEGLQAATETVTFALEADGRWRAAGYLIVPRSNTNSVAIEPAQVWLREIDAGHSAQSWTNAAAVFQQAITSEKWVEAVQQVRKPLGPLVSRELKSAQELTSLPGAPDGRYIVMQFETSFANKNAAVETVTFVLEKDGQWRAAGYYIK
jgi:hypothetical protein